MTVQARHKCEQASRGAVNFLGCWRNQHGSELTIKTMKDGRIDGLFKTGVGAHDPNEEFAVTGFVSDDLITFSVDFGHYDCLTSWAGQMTNENGIERVYTMWHLARGIPENAEKSSLWAGIWTGADTFVRAEDKDERNLALFDRPVFTPSYPFQVSKKR